MGTVANCPTELRLQRLDGGCLPSCSETIETQGKRARHFLSAATAVLGMRLVSCHTSSVASARPAGFAACAAARGADSETTELV